MNKLAEIGLIVIAVSAVAIADVFIKKAAFSADFKAVLKNPLMLAVVGLYLIQILVFAYVFAKKAELGAVGIIQTALYAIIVIGSGIIFFKEDVSLQQGIGMALAIIGVIVINLS
jgi:drug/metabolite transporter (DMT)-like permease